MTRLQTSLGHTILLIDDIWLMLQVDLHLRNRTRTLDTGDVLWPASHLCLFNRHDEFVLQEENDKV
jgi:hypothetical protein